MGEAGWEGEFGDGAAVRGRATVRVDGVQGAEALAGFVNGRNGRRVEPAQIARVAFPPDCTVEREARQIGLQNFGRVEAGQSGGRGFLPQAIGNAGDWRAARPARCVTLACAARSVTRRVIPAPRS